MPRIILLLLTIIAPLSVYAQQPAEQPAVQPGAQPVKLGRLINSPVSELKPIISPDGRTLYFVRNGHPENLGQTPVHEDQDAWFSRLQPDGEWGPAGNVGAPINNDHANGFLGISGDGTRGIVSGYYQNGELLKRGYSFTRLVGGQWTAPEGIDIQGYSELVKGKSISACLSEDAETIIFSLSRESDNNNQDLYVTTHADGKNWSAPVALASLNTSDDDACPFLASDRRTLYFSSTRPGGFGSYDVYMSRRVGEGWDSWTTPVNLGPTINTEHSELYYTIPASGTYAYYSSSMNADQTDLYRVALPEAVRPNPVVIIKGKTLDSKTNKPISTEVVYESLGDGKKQGSVQSDSVTGEYQIILNSGVNYGFYAKNEGSYPVSEHLDLTTLDSYREMTKDLTVARIDSGSTVSMQNLFFDVNKFTLREESKPELERLIAIMDSFPDMQVQINGHSDVEGAAGYNMYLSKNRATAVRLALLASSSIHGSRLTVQGFGATQPVADNTTEAGRQLNRRVEFQILRSGVKRNPYAQLDAAAPGSSRTPAVSAQ